MANSSSTIGVLEDYARRLIRVAMLLVDMHMDIAIQEANYEKQRLISGFVMLAIGVGLLAMGLTLLQVVGILVAHLLGLSWLWATTVVALVNFGVGSILAAAANSRLQGPLMVQTQKRLARSAAILKNRDLLQENS